MYCHRSVVRLVALSLMATFALAVVAADFTSSGSNLTARVDEKFVDPLSIVYPPGSNFHFRADLGFLVFDPTSFDATNLLAVPTAFGAATVFPVSVSETNGTTGRERLWSAGSGSCGRRCRRPDTAQPQRSNPSSARARLGRMSSPTSPTAIRHLSRVKECPTWASWRNFRHSSCSDPTAAIVSGCP